MFRCGSDSILYDGGCNHSRLRAKQDGYSFQVEMKYRAWRMGFTRAEVPIVFTERTEGQSKMSKTIVREAAFGSCACATCWDDCSAGSTPPTARW